MAVTTAMTMIPLLPGKVLPVIGPKPAGTDDADDDRHPKTPYTAHAPRMARPSRREGIRSATDMKITRAVMHIALTKGVNAVSIEEVSRVSGVAKTTIYRRYRNRDELLDGVCRQMADVPWPAAEDTPLSQEGIASLIRTAIGHFEDSFGVRGVGMMLTSTSEFLRRVVATVLEPARRHIDAYVERGVRAGVFTPDIDVSLIIDTVIGSITTSAALHDGLSDDWADRLARLLWRAVRADPAETPETNVSKDKEKNHAD